MTTMSSSPGFANGGPGEDTWDTWSGGGGAPQTYEHLRTHQDGHVLHVRLHAPRTGNAVTSAMLAELLHILLVPPHLSGIRALVLSGSGEHFCVGADRDEYQAALDADPGGSVLRVVADQAQRVCDALETYPAVTIARVHGKAIGAGLGLAAFCDLRAGADTSTFRMPELVLGLPPAWGGALGRLIGESGASRIRELILTSEQFTAHEAAGIALLHKVVPIGILDGVISEWTKPLARRAPEAIALAKTMLADQARAARGPHSALLDPYLLAAHMARTRPTIPG